MSIKVVGAINIILVMKQNQALLNMYLSFNRVVRELRFDSYSMTNYSY